MTDNPSPLDLPALKAAAAAMTPGEWSHYRHASLSVVSGNRGICSTGGYQIAGKDTLADNQANAIGIIAMRNNIDALIATAERGIALEARLRDPAMVERIVEATHAAVNPASFAVGEGPSRVERLRYEAAAKAVIAAILEEPK